MESKYVCELGVHAKFRNPTTTASGVLNNGRSQGGAQSRPVSRRQITVTSRPAPAPAPEHVTVSPPVDEIADRLANMHMSSQDETENSNFNPSAQDVPYTDSKWTSNPGCGLSSLH